MPERCPPDTGESGRPPTLCDPGVTHPHSPTRTTRHRPALPCMSFAIVRCYEPSYRTNHVKLAAQLAINLWQADGRGVHEMSSWPHGCWTHQIPVPNDSLKFNRTSLPVWMTSPVPVRMTCLFFVRWKISSTRDQSLAVGSRVLETLVYWNTGH